MPENAPESEPPSEHPKPHYGKESTFKGKKGRSGSKPGNQNSTRHGMKGSKLPAGCQSIENRVNELRRQVEAAILAAKGEISITDAAAVNSILKWERHGLLAARWLRKEADKLSATDRLRFSEATAKASDNRDKNIRALGLDRDRTQDVFESLYGSPRIILPPEPKEGKPPNPAKEGGQE